MQELSIQVQVQRVELFGVSDGGTLLPLSGFPLSDLSAEEMTGYCYYCGKPNCTRKARSLTTGSIDYVCDYHARIMERCEDGRNAGYNSGIG